MKEYLLKIKRLLERKCFASNYGEEYDIESYLNVIESIDNEGAFNYINEFINSTIEYYKINGIEYDEINLYPKFSLYYDSKYENSYPYTTNKNVRPIKEILRIYINGVGYTKNNKKKTIDPDDINESKDFIITFDDFKKILEKNGLVVEYSSFDDILKDYRNHKSTVCIISKSSNKIKKLVKEK